MNYSEKGLLSRRDFLRAGAATLAGTSLLSLAGCDSALITPNTDAYDLNIGYAEYVVDGIRARTRTYGGSIPGPTLYTAPGRRLRITINNGLPPNPPPGDGGMGGGGHAPKTREFSENDPHDFNTTNLHVHGLQVRPHLFAPFGTSNPSSPMIAIQPGQRYTYDFEVPADQPSGLYWYHPHHHGSTALQVNNGMAGLIVVRGPIDEVPEIAAAREELIAVQMLRISPSKDDPDLWVNDPIAYEPDTEGGFTTGMQRSYFLVNGHPAAWLGPQQSAPTNQLGVDSIHMQPGEVVRYRFLNGTDQNLMPIAIEGLDMHVIAYDGVNLPSPTAHDSVEVPPGGRLEFLVRAEQAGTYQFKMLPVIGKQFDDCQGFLFANVVVSGSRKEMALPVSLPLPQREYPFIQGSDIVATKHLHFKVAFPFPELITGVGFLINDQLYDHARIDHTARLGTCEEWTLTANDSEGHPFHLHVNSFWVIEENGVPLPEPIVKDVVWIPKNGSVTIRVRFKQWTGKSVYHCHILFHEDTGMMQNFMINA